MSVYRVGIMGATGYTGSELVRLLHGHPQVEICYITSESRAGEPFGAVHPALARATDLTLQSVETVLENPDTYAVDCVFLALPHGVSMDYVKRLQALDTPPRVVDFSGDFRLSEPTVYTQWYQKPHHFPEGFSQAVYGLPELFGKAISEARLVANPGCFPTATLLALAPLLSSQHDAHWQLSPAFCIVDAKTGVTGAGVKASSTTHFANVHDNLKAYGLKSHRHTIEIQEIIEAHQETVPPVQFTPHLLPVDRGIFATLYLRLTQHETLKKEGVTALREHYAHYYRDHPFVHVCSQAPTLKDVRGTNACHVYVDWDPRTDTVIVLSALDNLIKGAAGQAIQNMNLMLGLPETLGLSLQPLSP